MQKYHAFRTGVLAAACFLVAATGAMAFEFVQYDFSNPSDRWQSDTSAGGKDQDTTLAGDFGSVVSFSTINVGGVASEVMFVPNAVTGYCRYQHNFPGNGGGSYLNQYTVIADIMWPSGENGTWRAVFASWEYPVVYANTSDQLSVYYAPWAGSAGTDHPGGTVAGDTWYRIVTVVDLTKSVDSVVVYLDGTRVASGDVTGGLDNDTDGFASPYSMYHYSPYAGETGDVYISCFQIRDYAAQAAEAAAIGSATGAGVPAPDPPGKKIAVDASAAPFPGQAQGFTFADQITITVTNEGNSEVLNVTPSLTGADAGECSVSPNTAQALSPGASVDFDITWTPGVAVGSRDVQLSLAHDGLYIASPVVIQVGGIVSPNIATNLVLHLKLDGNLTDSSGMGHNAAAVGSFSYVTGPVGQGVGFTQDWSSYLTLGSFSAGQDLYFGAGQDFTVSMWIRLVSGVTGWPVCFSNKDWDSGGNPGYLFGVYDDPTPYANLGPERHDIYVSGVGDFSDNEWHNFTVTLDRDGYCRIYFDGQLGVSEDMSDVTNLEPGLAININADGLGNYAAEDAFEYDDIGVWRRVLAGGDVSGIHEYGRRGLDLSNVGPKPTIVTAVADLPNYVWKSQAVPTTITVTISNGGLVPLNMANFMMAGAQASEYSFTNPGATSLYPGKSVDIEVLWTPDAGLFGAHQGALAFTHNDAFRASPYGVDISSAVYEDIARDILNERFNGLTLGPSVWEPGGTPDGRIGFTHTPPPGWTVEIDPATDPGGVPEWYGWSFSTIAFWDGVAGQGRSAFTRAVGILAIADGDEHDDSRPSGAEYYLDTTLHSPVLTIPAGEWYYVSWDNDYWHYGSQRGYFWISYDDGSSTTLNEFSSDAPNQQVIHFLEPLLSETDIQLHWRYTGHNDWWWALDNIRVRVTAAIEELSARGSWALYE